jgi:GNAT superfamily N-acetyltransferase
MSDPNLPQGYSIRRTAQSVWVFFDLFIIGVGFVGVTIFFLCLGFYWVLLGDLRLLLGFGLVFGLALVLWLVLLGIWIEVKKAGRSRRPEKWIVSFQGSDVGTAAILRMNNFVSLSRLEIQDNHQRRGLGTALIKSVISEINQPIYLICGSDLETFYRRLGFVAIIREGTALRMKRAATGSTLGLDDLDKVNLPHGHTVEILRGKAKRQAQLLLLKHWWIESLYLKVISLVWLLFGVWGCFVLLPHFQWGEWNNIDLPSIFVRIQFLCLFCLVVLLRFSKFLPNHYLTVRSNGKILMSAYLGWGIYSAELYIVCKGRMPKEQDIKAALIQLVAKVVDVPVYLVCDRQHSDFYAGMGFTPIAKRKLPFFMRILGKSSGIAMRYPAVCE